MEQTDLTIRILQEIRDEIRIQGDRTDKRFEVLETTLRDFAEQMVLLARGSQLRVRPDFGCWP